MRFAMSMAVVALVSSPAVLRADEPCVPDGGTINVVAPTPSLTAPGMPVGASWTGAEGAEQDVGPDDSMGDATIGADGVTSIQITNNGGSLEGPNGEDVERGDGCIEFYFLWHYTYPCTSSTSFEFFGFGWTFYWTQYKMGSVSSAVVEFCPC